MTLLKMLINKYWLSGVLAIILLVIWRYIVGIQAENQQRLIKITQLELVIKNRDSLITNLTQQNKNNQLALTQLQKQLQQSIELVNGNEIELERLKNDDKDLKLWADTALPADVIRLYSRSGTINNSRDYKRFLSASKSLHNSGQ
ncbi:hypothetical protein RHO15_05855 [Utexia brackfieldae]|uniref:hypothetical protein n=1 Tax=Utexia brackfieldae TaxID=3074108 RepID=UPI00370D5531